MNANQRFQKKMELLVADFMQQVQRDIVTHLEKEGLVEEAAAVRRIDVGSLPASGPLVSPSLIEAFKEIDSAGL